MRKKFKNLNFLYLILDLKIKKLLIIKVLTTIIVKVFFKKYDFFLYFMYIIIYY